MYYHANKQEIYRTTHKMWKTLAIKVIKPYSYNFLPTKMVRKIEYRHSVAVPCSYLNHPFNHNQRSIPEPTETMTISTP